MCLGYVKNLYLVFVMLPYINPRQSKLFFVTSLTKGGLSPPMNLKKKRLSYDYLVPWYSYRSLLSIHTKKYKHPVYNVRFCTKLLIWKSSKHRNFTAFFCLLKMEIRKSRFNIRMMTIQEDFFLKIMIFDIVKLHHINFMHHYLAAYLPYLRVRCYIVYTQTFVFSVKRPQMM